MGDNKQAPTVESLSKQVEELSEGIKSMQTLIQAKKDEKAKEDDLQQKGILAAMAGGAPVHYPVAGIRHDSIEQKALRNFGCANVAELVQVNTSHPNFSYVPDEQKQMVTALKADLDVSRFMQQIFHNQPRDRSTEEKDINGNVKGLLDGNYYGKNVLAPKVKAYGTGTATEGAELLNTVTSSMFIEEFELEFVVANAFQTIQMPSKDFNLPFEDGLGISQVQGEGATIASTNENTGDINFSADRKLTKFVKLPEELNEDSAPNFLAIKRMGAVKSAHRAIEQAILGGHHTANVGDAAQDSDITGIDGRYVWDGLRRKALVNSATVDFGNAAITTPNARALRTLMLNQGANPKDLLYIAGIKGWNQMKNLDETTQHRLWGPNSTIRTGRLDDFDGVDLVVSDYVRADLNASGVYDGVTTDRTALYLVKASRFMLGIRRPIKTRAVPNPVPPNDEWMIVSWFRGDFQGLPQSATEVSVVLGINIA